VLSVVAAGGARLPGALVLVDRRSRSAGDHDDLATPLRLERLGSARHLRVGDGAVWLPDVTVRVRRWWDQPTVRMPDQPAALRAARVGLATALNRGGGLPAPVAVAAQRLAAALGTDDAASTAGAVHAMVGLGPGLTPAADDVLVGALLCWHHAADAGWSRAGLIADPVVDAVRERLLMTSAVSAALLHHATRGAGVPEALQLLDAFRSPAGVGTAVDVLTLVGHDTGRSMAYGVGVALDAVLALEPERVTT
jgi:hypothetical protein